MGASAFELHALAPNYHFFHFLLFFLFYKMFILFFLNYYYFILFFQSTDDDFNTHIQDSGGKIDLRLIAMRNSGHCGSRGYRGKRLCSILRHF